MCSALSISTRSIRLNYRGGVIWNHQWIRPFESFWSVMQRFSVKNFPDLPTLLDLIVVDKNNCPKALLVKQLTQGDRLSYRKLANLLLTAESVIESMFPQNIIPNLHCGKLSYQFCSSHLRYCQSCLLAGYHSTYFQLNSLNECPIHNRALYNACHHCGAGIPYQITATNLSAPYSCPHCGEWLSATVDRKLESTAIINLDAHYQSSHLCNYISLGLLPPEICDEKFYLSCIDWYLQHRDYDNADLSSNSFVISVVRDVSESLYSEKIYYITKESYQPCFSRSQKHLINKALIAPVNQCFKAFVKKQGLDSEDSDWTHFWLPSELASQGNSPIFNDGFKHTFQLYSGTFYRLFEALVPAGSANDTTENILAKTTILVTQLIESYLANTYQQLVNGQKNTTVGAFERGVQAIPFFVLKPTSSGSLDCLIMSKKRH